MQTPSESRELSQINSDKGSQTRIEPVCNDLKAVIFDFVIQDLFGQEDMEWSWGLTDRGKNRQAAIDQHIQLIGNGLESIDEGRTELGHTPWGLPETSIPLILTPTGPVPLQAVAGETPQPGVAGAQPQQALPAGGQQQPKPGQPPQLTDDELTTPAHEAAQDLPGTSSTGGKNNPSGSASSKSPGSAPAKTPAKDAPDKAADAAKQARELTELEYLARHLRKGRTVAQFRADHLPAEAMAAAERARPLGVRAAVDAAKSATEAKRQQGELRQQVAGLVSARIQAAGGHQGVSVDPQDIPAGIVAAALSGGSADEAVDLMFAKAGAGLDMTKAEFGAIIKGVIADLAAAGISAPPVDSAVVRAQLAANYRPEGISWVTGISWAGPAPVPLDRIDWDHLAAWSASHDGAHVAHFKDRIRAGGRPRPAVMVQVPGSPRLKVIDGHHRSLAYKELGEPVPAFIGLADTDSPASPMWRTHLYQQHSGGDPMNKAAGDDDPSRVAFLLIRAVNPDGKWRYLLQKRGDETKNGGTWGLPGGRCHDGEVPWDAAVREAGEELGDMPAVAASAVFTRPEGDHVVWTYLVELSDLFAPSADGATADETAGWGWFRKRDVADLDLHPAMRETWEGLDFGDPLLGGKAVEPERPVSSPAVVVNVSGSTVMTQDDIDKLVSKIGGALGFQRRGEASRQAAGVDGTAGDAQDMPHPFAPDAGGDPQACVTCGLGRDAEPHGEDARKDASGYKLSARSGMIALDLPDGLIPQVPGGVEDGQHITIAYLGKDVTDEAFAEACRRAASAAASAPGPLSGVISGRGTFPPSESSKDRTPVWAGVTLPGVEALREALADLSASEHLEWRPHVTRAYIDEGDPLPGALPPVPVTFTHLSVHRADEVARFTLGGNDAAGEPHDGDKSTCPCSTPVVYDWANGWQHADGSVSHDDGESVSGKMAATAKAANPNPKVRKAAEPATWPGWALSTVTADYWSTQASAAAKKALTPALLNQMAADYVAANPGQQGDEPDKNDRNKKAAAWVLAWLAKRGIKAVPAAVASGLAADAYAVGTASAAAAANGDNDADMGGWSPGDTDSAADTAERLGAGDDLGDVMSGSGDGTADGAQQHLNGTLAAGLAVILAGFNASRQAGILGGLLGGYIAGGAWGSASALTAVAVFSGLGALQWYQRNNVALVQWLCGADSCTVCRQNAAASPRAPGVPWPSSAVSPPQHPSCACALGPAAP